MLINFGEYLPDLPVLGNQGLIQANNCIPYAKSYRYFPNLSEYSVAISNRVQGYIGIKDNLGNSYNYCGDISNLYKLSGTEWSDASRTSGGSYATDAAESWEFIQWGNQVVASNWTDSIQVITAGASNFAALSGSPPKAKHIGIVRDFLVLGYCTDTAAASNPIRIQWSGFGNITEWTPSLATQSSWKDIYGEGGDIMKVIGGEYGIIMQERAIWRLTYIGSPVVFQLDNIEPNKGTIISTSVVSSGRLIFYLGNDDFYVFNGTQSIPIGNNKIYQTFISDLDPAYDYRITAATDPVKTLVLWAYPGIGNTGGRPNKILIYNWALNRWSTATLEIELLCNTRQQGFTMETLDSISTSLDSLPYSLDSREWQGGTINLAAFSSNHKLSFFAGSALTATFETGERLLPARTLITNIRPMIDSTKVSMYIGKRNLLSENVTYSSGIHINSAGECPIIAEGRYNRFKMVFSASAQQSFSHAQGIEIDEIAQGKY